MEAYPTLPGSVSAPDAVDPVTQLVPHEDAPAFSDIATTATAAATAPLTTFSPTTPRPSMSLLQVSSKDKSRGLDKKEPTTDSLTTQVTLNNRGSVSKNPPAASSSSHLNQPQSLSGFPKGATAIPPSSGRMEKGEVKEEPVKHRAGADHPLPGLTDGTSTTSTVITTTTVTTLQTSGECLQQAQLNKTRSGLCLVSPAGMGRKCHFFTDIIKLKVKLSQFISCGRHFSWIKRKLLSRQNETCNRKSIHQHLPLAYSTHTHKLARKQIHPAVDYW